MSLTLRVLDGCDRASFPAEARFDRSGRHVHASGGSLRSVRPLFPTSRGSLGLVRPPLAYLRRRASTGPTAPRLPREASSHRCDRPFTTSRGTLRPVRPPLHDLQRHAPTGTTAPRPPPEARSDRYDRQGGVGEPSRKVSDAPDETALVSIMTQSHVPDGLEEVQEPSAPRAPSIMAFEETRAEIEAAAAGPQVPFKVDATAAIASLFLAKWDVIGPAIGGDLRHVKQALRLADELAIAVSKADELVARRKETAILRSAAFTLCVESVREAERGIDFLRFHHGDARKIVPSIFDTVKFRRRAKAEDVTPALAAPTLEDPALGDPRSP